MPRQLHHVVGLTALLVIGAQLDFRAQTVGRRKPRFGVGRTAGRICACRADLPKKEVGDVVEPHVAGDLVPACRGDRLRNVRVAMQAAQLVASERERVDEDALLEAKLTKKKRKAKVDRVAAQMILQSFIDAGSPTGGTDAIFTNAPLPTDANPN